MNRRRHRKPPRHAAPPVPLLRRLPLFGAVSRETGLPAAPVTPRAPARQSK